MKFFQIIIALRFCISSFFAQKDSQVINSKIDSILATIFSAEDPGGSVLVANKNEIIYHKAFGKANLESDVDMTKDHIFKIASNTKPFITVAVLKLIEEKKLSLDDNIDNYLEGIHFD